MVDGVQEAAGTLHAQSHGGLYSELYSIYPGPHPPRSMSRASFIKLNGMKTSCLVIPQQEPVPSLPSHPTGCQASNIHGPATMPALSVHTCHSLHLTVFFCAVVSSGLVSPMQAACWHLRAWGH